MANPARKLLRRILRKILAHLSRWALEKHDPEIIAVVGEGKTGIAREAIYQALKRGRYPARRNIEAPDAEFVLPLIILGSHEYPRSYLGWLKVLAKALGLLLFRPSYKHLLVLEIGYSYKEIFDYFWELTRPSTLVICGTAPYLAEVPKPKHTIRIKETGTLEPYLKAAVKVAKLFGIKGKEAEEALSTLSLPSARIQILPSKGGGLIIDATYQYYPPSEESLDEVLEALPGKKIFFTPKMPKRLERAEVKRGEVGVISGPKKKMWPLLLELIKTPWLD